MSSETEIVHIGLDFPDNVPDLFIEKVTEDLKTSGLIIKVGKHPTLVMMAAVDWVLPTAIAAYVLKPYFEGFLTEVSKDHYISLKNWLKKFADSGRAIKVHHITSSGAIDKKVGEDNQSRSVSLLLQTKNGKIIKLLFDNDLAKEDWDNAIDQLLDYTIDNYEKFPNDHLSQVLAELEPGTPFKIYAIIDKNTKHLLFYDDKGIVKLYDEQKSKHNSKDIKSDKKEIITYKLLPPNNCESKQLKDFYDLVVAGQQVATNGLEDRIKSADFLAFCEIENKIIGVASIKNPNINYKRNIFQKAKVEEQADNYKYEIGYAVTHETHRGKGISQELIKRLMDNSNANSFFATTKVADMRHILTKIGFTQLGYDYKNNDNETLTLYQFTRT